MIQAPDPVIDPACVASPFRAVTLGEAPLAQGSAPPGWAEQANELRQRVAAACGKLSASR